MPKSTAPASADPSSDPLSRLFAAIEASRHGDPAKSYTAKLFSRGRAKIAQKLGEEAVEAVIEAVRGDRAALICESADLLYHLMVTWSDAGIKPADIWAELARREGISGIAEKNAR
ncbi:MAG TPA: phosphoribosyl-ATP diphosphatase [Stellaceae bacterium]|nr:phosphoribosyl-ATP diphosphatase [Stellaceae bacterium]